MNAMCKPKNLLYIVFVFFTIVSFTACTPTINLSPKSSSIQQLANSQDSSVTIEDILKGDSLIAIANNAELYLIDPDFAKPLKVYTFSKDELPAKTSLDTFVVSPSKQWVVWYTPTKGFIALNIRQQKAQLIYPANDFLNTYPYLEFAPNQDTVMFITDNGNRLYTIALDSKQETKIDIPYPYGNVFKLAPDGNTVLFVSGYGQTKNNPKFMFTSSQGVFSKQFFSKTNLADRNWVFWAPDATGVLMINNNVLEFFSVINPDQPKPLITLNQNDQIITVKRINNSLFLLTKSGYWRVYDYSTKKEIARSPLEIASELQRPHFTPWSEKQYLIEETIVDGPSQFNRLWLSDFKGNKKILMEKYNEIVIQTETQHVD